MTASATSSCGYSFSAKGACRIDFGIRKSSSTTEISVPRNAGFLATPRGSHAYAAFGRLVIPSYDPLSSDAVGDTLQSASTRTLPQLPIEGHAPAVLHHHRLRRPKFGSKPTCGRWWQVGLMSPAHRGGTRIQPSLVKSNGLLHLPGSPTACERVLRSAAR
jgi:hypothetical protein